MPPSKERAKEWAQCSDKREPSVKRVGVDSSLEAAAKTPTCMRTADLDERPRSAVSARVPQESGKHRRDPRGSEPPMMFAMSGSRLNDQPTELESSESGSDSEDEKRDWTAEQYYQSDEWQECAQELWVAVVQEELDQVGYVGEDVVASEADLKQKIMRVRLGVMDVALRCEGSEAEAKELGMQQLWEQFLDEDEQEQQQRYSEFVSECWSVNWSGGHGVPLSVWKPVQECDGSEDLTPPPRQPRMFHLMRAGSERLSSAGRGSVKREPVNSTGLSAKVRGLPVGSNGVGTQVRGLPVGSRGVGVGARGLPVGSGGVGAKGN